MKKAYSLIVNLSGESYKNARTLQKEISTISGAKRSIEDWLPHITIGDGPLLSEEELINYERELSNFCKTQKKLIARLKGFTGIDNWKGAQLGLSPYVVWIDVEVSDDLKSLFEELRDGLTSKHEAWLPRTINYTPHLTLAFADLTKEGYEKSLELLKTKVIDQEFIIDNITIVECYGEDKMASVEYKRFYFEA
jgi:2'-5' RNA ligase